MLMHIRKISIHIKKCNFYLTTFWFNQHSLNQIPIFIKRIKNKTLKGRLKAELRKNGITTIIDDFNLSLIISQHSLRKMDNASSIKVNGEYYQPKDLKTGEIISFKKGTECSVIYAYDGKMYIEINDKIYDSYKVEVRQINLEHQEKIEKEKVDKKVVIKPSKNHPWKNFKI